MSYEVIGWLIAIVVFIGRGGGDGRAGLGLVHRRRGLRARRGDFGRGAGRAAGGLSGSVGSGFWRSSARSPGRNGRKSPSA